MDNTPQITESIRKNESEAILIDNYWKTLSEKEKKGLEIAKSHLGMSFQLEKSLGYLDFKKTLE
uniref:Uncharacterized protein n=1 Tax=viral metagenome TaxID=1070528 RepID=A0A6C0JJG0_9ZZZZ